MGARELRPDRGITAKCGILVLFALWTSHFLLSHNSSIGCSIVTFWNSTFAAFMWALVVKYKNWLASNFANVCPCRLIFLG